MRTQNHRATAATSVRLTHIASRRVLARALVLALAALTLLSGCKKSDPAPENVPADVDDGPIARAASAQISDQAHSGQSGFAFFPPVVPNQPTGLGAFATTASPTVRIDSIN